MANRPDCEATDVARRDEWNRVADRFDVMRDTNALRREFVDAVRGAIEDQLSKHQRQVFVAIVIDWLPARPWQSPLVQTATPSTRRCTTPAARCVPRSWRRVISTPHRGVGNEIVSTGAIE